MISTKLLGAGTGQVDYYLARQADYDLAYYRGDGESRGVWVGAGADTLGLAGALDETGEPALRAVLAGRHPNTGKRLVRPVLRADPAGRLPAAPLAAALRARAERSAVPVRELLPAALAGRAIQLIDQVDRAASRYGPGPTVRADQVGRLAATAGLNPVQLYRAEDGTDRFSPALAAAGGRVDVRRVGDRRHLLRAEVGVGRLRAAARLSGTGGPRRAHPRRPRITAVLGAGDGAGRPRPPRRRADRHPNRHRRADRSRVRPPILPGR